MSDEQKFWRDIVLVGAVLIIILVGLWVASGATWAAP